MIVSRLCILGITVVGLIIATYTTSIEAAWKFLLAMAAGLGLPQILRWIWWRTNAWTEVSGMAASLILSLILYPMYPDAATEHLLFAVAVGSALISIVVTLLTPPVDEQHLRRFVQRVDPLGAWPATLREASANGLAGAGSGTGLAGHRPSEGRRFVSHVVLWLLASTSVLAMMFAVGYALFSDWWAVAASLAVMLVTGIPAGKAFLAPEPPTLPAK